MKDNGNDPEGEAERVPLFGSWGTAYVTVTAVFACDVVLFYAISRYFS